MQGTVDKSTDPPTITVSLVPSDAKSDDLVM